MNKCGDETKDNEHDIWDFRKGICQYVEGTVAVDTYRCVLLIKLFLPVTYRYRKLPREDEHQQHHSQVQVEHSYDEHYCSTNSIRNAEHIMTKGKVGINVVFYEKGNSLDHSQYPGYEQELWLIFHGFEEYGKIRIAFLIVHKGILLALELWVNLLGVG